MQLAYHSRDAFFVFFKGSYSNVIPVAGGIVISYKIVNALIPKSFWAMMRWKCCET